MAVKTLLTPLTRGQVPQGLAHVPKRYSNAWSYQDDKERYFLGTFAPITIPPHSSDRLYILEAGDVARPDLIAYKHYGHPSFYWVVLWLNDITDPFEEMYPGMLLRIPTRRRLAEFGVKV